MLNKDLEKLLKEVDRAAGDGPKTTEDLAIRLLKRAKARKKTIYYGRFAAAAVLAMAIGAAIFLNRQGQGQGKNEQAVTIITVEKEQDKSAELQNRIAKLEAQIEIMRSERQYQNKLVEQILEISKERQKLAKLEYKLAAMPDVIDQIRQQRDRPAIITLYMADRKYNELGLEESAIKDYQKIIEMFPQTTFAETAREKLEQIGTSQI